MSISRRKFLKYSAVFGAGMGMQGVFPSFSMAQGMGSQTGEDYKALVCVFMLGGMDCHDTLIPYEQSPLQSVGKYSFTHVRWLHNRENPRKLIAINW